MIIDMLTQFNRGFLMPQATSLQQFLDSPASYNSLLLNGKATNADCVRLGAALKGNKTLIFLFLHDSQIEDAGAIAIAEGIKGMTSLVVSACNHKYKFQQSRIEFG